MLEKAELLSETAGYCSAPDGALHEPEKITTLITSQNSLIVECPRLDKKTGKCGVVFDATCLQVDARWQKENPIWEEETAVGLIVFNADTHEVLVSPLLPPNHEPVRLTPFESVITKTLLEHHGVVSREVLYAARWGEDSYFSRRTLRTVDVQVANLRQKIGQVPSGEKSSQVIRTIRNKGYCINRPHTY